MKHLSFLQELKQVVGIQTHYEQGLKSMMRGLYAYPRSESELKKAFESLKTAVENDDSKMDAYLALSYLLIGMGKFEVAASCLKEILTIEPKSHEAQFYLSLSHEKPKSFDFMPSVMQFIHQLKDLSTEMLFDILDELLAFKMLEVAQHVQSFKPNADTKMLAAMTGYLPNLIRYSQFMLENILHLEQDLDTTALRLKLEPLELMMNQLEQNISSAQDLLSIKEKLDEYSRALGQAIQMLNAPSPSEELQDQAEQLLEDVWNLSDRTKEGLDSYERQGVDIGLIQQYYDMMMILVDHLQDQL